MPHLDHFALLAPFYDRIFAGADTGRLREFLGLEGGRLLDVGGGTGRVSDTLDGLADLTVVTDLSRAMLTGARAKAGLEPARARAERLPFSDRSFDRVLVVDAFHHFSNHRLAAAEMVRVLAPGGRLVVQEMNLERLTVKLIALGERVTLMRSHFYRPDALRRLFEGPDVRVAAHADDTIDLWVTVEKLS